MGLEAVSDAIPSVQVGSGCIELISDHDSYRIVRLIYKIYNNYYFNYVYEL